MQYKCYCFERVDPLWIILGLRMDKAEENLAISMAREVGVKNIYKSFIDA